MYSDVNNVVKRLLSVHVIVSVSYLTLNIKSDYVNETSVLWVPDTVKSHMII